MFFAVVVIGGVAVLTAGAVAMFAIEPSAGAPELTPVVSAEPVTTAKQPAVTAEVSVAVASLDPSILPARKVVTTSIPVKAASAPAEPQPNPVKEIAKDAAAAMDALKEQDPRWAQADGEHGKAPAFDSMLPASKTTNAAAGTGAIALVDPATEAGDPADVTETAAIEPEVVKPKRAAKAKPEKPAEAAVEDNPLSPPGVGAETRTVQISKGVNMRSRPKSGSGVLTVIPKGAAVGLVDCNAWCEVVYKGQRGFIYKDFISGGGGGKANKSASRQPNTKNDDQAKTVYTLDAPKAEPTEPVKQTTSDVKGISSRLE